jgi:hypothetical protein
VRGDSLRDFYAKTLAVLGLGLLAGAGAIVDYWPVSEEMPTTPPASGLTAAAPVVVRNISIEIPAPEIRAARPLRVSAKPADFVASTEALRTLDVAPAFTIAMALESAPMPADFVAVKPIPANPTDAALDLNAPPLPDGMTDESRRLFGDALHRTKERIVAARGLFNDAMSNAMTNVVGAFRKMSPFFTTTAIVPGLD